MKVMVIVKASKSSEAGEMPTEELLNAMTTYNEELVKAGIMQSGDGLKPTSEGYRVRFDGNTRTVTKGPFAETNELLAGYWIWQVDSMEHAIEWVKKCPNPMYEASDIEIRSFYEMSDFEDADPNGEVAEKENALKQKIAMQNAAVNTYLFFYGRCEDALEYYKQHLGAEVSFLMRFSDAPESLPENMVPVGLENKIMHAQFKVANTEIFASDGCSADEQSSGFSIALTLAEKSEAERIFNALADGGKILMPLTPTFWSPLYGQVQDKFGINWMVMLPDATE